MEVFTGSPSAREAIVERGNQAHLGQHETPSSASTGCLMYRTAPETRTVPGQQAGRTDTHRASARERPLNSTGRIGQHGPARLLYRTWAPYNLSLWCAARTFTQQVRGSRLLVTREGFLVIFHHAETEE